MRGTTEDLGMQVKAEGTVNMKSCAWMICGILCTVLDKWTR